MTYMPVNTIRPSKGFHQTPVANKILFLEKTCMHAYIYVYDF